MLATETRFRVRRLAQCIAAVLTLSPPLAMAVPTTWTVNSCSEAVSGSSTTGTLRYAVQHAASGDIVDMSHLSCSTISLHTGAIHIPQSSLTLQGNNNSRLTITGKYNGNVEHDRVIDHTGTGGTLYIDHINLSFGYLKPASGFADGGCVYSAGNINMFDVGVYLCKATVTGNADVFGGAVFARGSLSVQYGTFSGNTADAGSGGGFSFGGALVSGGTFTAYYSSFTNNAALGAALAGTDGAVLAEGNVVLTASTVSDNYSSGSVGGFAAFSSHNASATTTITNSTISGNSAAQYTGGLFANSGKVYLNNSTIAFNTAGTNLDTGNTPNAYYAAGVAISDAGGAVTVDMRSTLIANNTVGTGTPSNSDFSVPALTSNITLFGTNNLIRTHVPDSLDFLPAGTIENTCPLLGPLRNNGGLTQTHALLSHSPGIDQGNNSRNLTEDQRGQAADFLPPFPYARESGSAADIGAYEVQQNDIVFNASFEGCP
jgi:hypothetical protein